ncbi:hypothetical protein EDD18DRAFT_1107724 [Armillaria luteobubalina]|uniref:Uncharacterized protein n=1 Tax=Armillaria luteobubalina TaxID=153913 RepID=A0AA39Q003_9AGAR|nr:hypothetical protein EDD18DRAFT_1107724 [Armillaria luteobubalina]
MIVDSMHAEQLQENQSLGPHSTNLQHAQVLKKEANLCQWINAWMDAQCIYIPEIMGIRDQMEKNTERDCIVAWNIPLLLPSKLLALNFLTCDKRLYQYEWEVRLNMEDAIPIKEYKKIWHTNTVNPKMRETSGETHRQLPWIWVHDGAMESINSEGFHDAVPEALLMELPVALELMPFVKQIFTWKCEIIVRLWRHVDKWLFIGNIPGEIVNEHTDNRAEDED